MLSVDSLKLGIPVEAFEWIDLNKHNVEESIKRKQGRVISDTCRVKNLDHGISSFMLDNMGNKVVLNTSAKALKDNYRQGISLNTVDQFIETLNGTGICSISSGSLLEYADVYTVDPCTTIDVENLSESTRAVLVYTSANSSYSVKDFHPSGYVARKNVKSYIERQVGYSKLTEVTAKKSTFAKDYPNAVKCFNENSLRIENNITAASQIRKRLRVINTKLGTVLNSAEHPVYSTFMSIIQKGKQIELFTDRFNGMSLPDIRNECGWDSIFSTFENDLDKIIGWVRSNWTHDSGKRTYYYKIVRAEYARRNKAKVLDTNSRIDEIISLLKVA